MPKIDQIISDIRSFCNNHFSEHSNFCCIYGSFATNNQSKSSDLDILFSSLIPTEKDFKKIRSFIIRLHMRYNLSIDEEIPYTNKLLISYNRILKATELRHFKTSNDEYYIPELQNSAEYLNSPEVQERLLLNIFTTPNIFVAGNIHLYSTAVVKFEESLIKLARGLLLPGTLATQDSIYQILTKNKEGSYGRSHLGYKVERPIVDKYLRNILNRQVLLN